jgi:signal transduction histidine kinase/CheY-like chemotaxis protein
MMRPDSPDTRVLVLTPTSADARVTAQVLKQAGVTTHYCASAAEMAHQIAVGAGAIIVTDDITQGEPFEDVRFMLARQPSWSELPLLLLARADAPRLEEMRSLPGVVLLERPVHLRSLVSAAQAALRARLRQYELRDLLERMRAANFELQRAARAKDDFLATLSHELRNPLSALTAAASLLDRPGLSTDADLKARQVVKRQTAQMARLLDDLLDIARITRGRLEIRKVRAELSPIVRAAVETVQPMILKRGHVFTLTMPERELVLEADPLRLSQVIANLLTNAAKYTPDNGRIELIVEREADAARIRVRDNGIGIAPESRAEIFGMFSQLHPAIERSEGGLGIGLALAKGLVDLHGGGITVSSAGLGHGSEFAVRIPCVPAVTQVIASDPRRDRPTAQLDLILADDNRDALESLAMLLEVEGHAVRVASDGAAALELFEQRVPRVMLLDIGMPGMNGYDVARKVRAAPGGSGVLLVALTGWGQSTDRELAQEAGFDHHLTKPVDFDELLTLLEGLDRSPHLALVSGFDS